MKYYTEDQMMRELQKQCRRAGGQLHFGKLHGFSSPFISDVLMGRRNITEKLAIALGYEFRRMFIKSA